MIAVTNKKTTQALLGARNSNTSEAPLNARVSGQLQQRGHNEIQQVPPNDQREDPRLKNYPQGIGM